VDALFDNGRRGRVITGANKRPLKSLLGVGLIGLKAAEAVGRNPAASGKVLVQAIIGMALAEGLGILALFLAK
jgi:F-type H+-transporting ATPase subunit c